MSSEAKLFETIRAQYTQWPPYRAYADDVEQQGDPDYAEYIRLEYRLEQPFEDEAERRQMKKRFDKLFRKYCNQWDDITGATNVWSTWGVPTNVVMQAAAFLDHGEQVCQRLPIWGIWFGSPQDHFPPGHVEQHATALAQLPCWSHFREINFHGECVQVRGLTTVLSAATLTRLARLCLASNPLGDEAAAVLASTPALHTLTDLQLEHAKVSTAGVKTLTASPHLRLQSLALHYDQLGDEAAEILANAPSLAGLRTLDLLYSDIGPEGVKALMASPYLTQLTRLSLAGNGRLNAEAMHALAQSPNVAKLVKLDLYNWDFGDADMKQLIESPHLSPTLNLNISKTAMKDRLSGKVQKALKARFATIT